MSDELVRYETRGKVAVLQMDDGKVNALSHAMLDSLSAAFGRARDEEDGVRAVALLGRPGKFSAGFDLKTMMSGPDPMRALVRAGVDLLMHLYEYPMPVVVGVTGHAIAGGVLLSAGADIRIGARGPFKIGLNEISVGMPVPIFAQELARARLDPRALVAATLHATMYDPDAAAAVGWLDEVVEADVLEARVMAEAERLSERSGKAYALSKKTLHRQTIDYVRSTLDANLEMFRVG